MCPGVLPFLCPGVIRQHHRCTTRQGSGARPCVHTFGLKTPDLCCTLRMVVHVHGIRWTMGAWPWVTLDHGCAGFRGQVRSYVCYHPAWPKSGAVSYMACSRATLICMACSGAARPVWPHQELQNQELLLPSKASLQSSCAQACIGLVLMLNHAPKGTFPCCSLPSGACRRIVTGVFMASPPDVVYATHPWTRGGRGMALQLQLLDRGRG